MTPIMHYLMMGFGIFSTLCFCLELGPGRATFIWCGSGFGSKVLAHVMLRLKFFGHRQPAQTIAFGQILLIYYQFFG